MIKLSIVIVNYQGWQPLRTCLESIKEIEGIQDIYEVIVVDNCSNDGMLDNFRTQFPEIKFVENEGNYGFSSGNNLGAKHASGEYILFLNPDTIINSAALHSMLNLAVEHPSYYIVSIQQLTTSGQKENPFNSFPSIWTINSILKSIYSINTKNRLKAASENEPIIKPDWVSGSVILMQKQIFDKIGKWDEDYWLYTEDVDLCRKTRKAGGEIAMICDNSFVHQHGGTTRKTMKLAALCKAHVIISKHIYFRKHYKGFHHFSLQFFLLTNTLILESLLPALIGLITYPFSKNTKYQLVYLNLLKYYFSSLMRKTWFIDIKKIKIPTS